ncbi:acyl-CoA dehydrogenase [Ovoidimarina sediminis]|uniref:acyl-CoA dehydrogenase n=1 Tax=Ovoidimarina sediminis TaxID=3079856 RepID=UPI002910D2D5|nr:acyl-CoA dehydrogenase [Rhodophyticola sp. MJ-SS7]MDU8943510.1 acyl-CoA dehydrogenase [Rhodophyticola sp. MJ-SS7]
MPYRAAADEIRFLLETVCGFDSLREAAGEEALAPDVLAAILDEAASLCNEVIAPLQRVGDLQPPVIENGVVRASPGFGEAYRAYAEGGWVGMLGKEEYGGMNLPVSVAMGVHDMLAGACMSFQLQPLLTQAQIGALEAHASDALKALYLPKLTSGEWAGTMNLTEPQAGSDLGALRTKAEPGSEGTYRVSGQKIYISWGDSDMTDNIVHLVLARLPDAPAGTKGLSLFLVPKFLPDASGGPGPRNGVRVVSLEHKLGLHGSPTAVMEFDGATGWLVGHENGGIEAMFTMMNEARLGTGMQGVGVGEAAYQHAAAFAADRKQGKTGGETGAIHEFADVRRMLVWMRARVTAARAVALSCATALDMAAVTGSAQWQARAAFLTPIAKAFSTQVGIDVAQMGIQVHGGMGVIEETGAAQYLRDVRVSAIYEGTNGIQSVDLVGRKMRDGGEAALALIDEIEGGAEAARATRADLAGAVWEAAETLREATEWMAGQPEPVERFAGALPYLQAFGLVLGAHFHLRAAMSEAEPGPRTALARAFIRRQLPEHVGLLAEATVGATDLFDVTPEALGI